MIFIVSLDLEMASIDRVHPILSLDLIFRPTSNNTLCCVSTFELGRVLYTGALVIILRDNANYSLSYIDSTQ